MKDGEPDQEFGARTEAGSHFHSIKKTFLGQRDIQKPMKIQIYKKEVTPVKQNKR